MKYAGLIVGGAGTALTAAGAWGAWGWPWAALVAGAPLMGIYYLAETLKILRER